MLLEVLLTGAQSPLPLETALAELKTSLHVDVSFRALEQTPL
jgi:hypothetical protein